MVLKQDDMVKELAQEFTPPQAALLARVITTAYNDLVKTGLSRILGELREKD